MLCKATNYPEALLCNAARFQGANFKDVMQQLLPAEQAPKPASSPNKGSPGGSKQEQGVPQRASSTAKASTPKRQDQVTTKPAGGPKSTGVKSGDRDKEKDRMDRDRSHSARRDAARPQPVRLLSLSAVWQMMSSSA